MDSLLHPSMSIVALGLGTMIATQYGKNITEAELWVKHVSQARKKERKGFMSCPHDD